MAHTQAEARGLVEEASWKEIQRRLWFTAHESVRNGRRRRDQRVSLRMVARMNLSASDFFGLFPSHSERIFPMTTSPIEEIDIFWFGITGYSPTIFIRFSCWFASSVMLFFPHPPQLLLPRLI